MGDACAYMRHLRRHPLHGRFIDSTRRGDAEAGDNNQIQVALVFQYLFSEGYQLDREAVVWLGYCE